MSVNRRPLAEGWEKKMGCRQLLVAEADAPSSFQATLSVYEREGGKWVQKMKRLPAVIGRNGLTGNKKEGDGKTPTGLYELGAAFGTLPAPAGLAVPYRQVTTHDYWVDDPGSPDYNRWVYYEGNPTDRWRSFERLYIPLYRHVVIIRYNMQPIVPGKGSAIFLHEWAGPDKPTAGCVAVSFDHLAQLLGLLDPAKRPCIFMSAAASN